jgi:hypothetical protein
VTLLAPDICHHRIGGVERAVRYALALTSSFPCSSSFLFWERGATTARRAGTATQTPTDRPRPTGNDRGAEPRPAAVFSPGCQ